MNLRQHTALVTGATSGIGRALALALHREGARVFATGRNPQRLARLAAEAPGIEPLAADLVTRESRQRLVRTVLEKAPRLTLLVNNAAVQHLADHARAAGTETRTRQLAAVREELAVNVDAVVDLTLSLLPHLQRIPEAAVVLMSSGLALAPKKSSPVYCASKAFLHSFGKALRYQCEDACPHVHVMEVLPPVVDTPMTAGRGRRKLPPEIVAAAVLAGLRTRRREVDVGAVRWLRLVQRFAPELADRLLRNQ